ncbi:hypothetical protein SAMN05216404_11512 [Nitrosospira multiformis]|uniref:Uncharacterized protein n=1 Tax=Nitrosospira multiformis TaxID=1231 RepID=A0A1H8N3Z5_9PROT|nr:hypothetical protein SAMN05216404_11512 [Nitrosospira multiformis]
MGIIQALERKNAQLALSQRRSDRPGRGANHTRGLVRERVLAPRAACPVDCVFKASRNRAIEFRRYEKYGIDIGYGLLEGTRDRWKVRIQCHKPLSFSDQLVLLLSEAFLLNLGRRK